MKFFLAPPIFLPKWTVPVGPTNQKIYTFCDLHGKDLHGFGSTPHFELLEFMSMIFRSISCVNYNNLALHLL